MQIHSDEVHEEELKAPKVIGAVIKEGTSEEHHDHDMTEPRRPIDPPREANTHNRRQTWPQEIIQDAKNYGVPNRTSR